MADTTGIAQLTAGGVLALVILREVFSFVKTKKNGNGIYMRKDLCDERHVTLTRDIKEIKIDSKATKEAQVDMKGTLEVIRDRLPPYDGRGNTAVGVTPPSP